MVNIQHVLSNILTQNESKQVFTSYMRVAQ